LKGCVSGVGSIAMHTALRIGGWVKSLPLYGCVPLSFVCLACSRMYLVGREMFRESLGGLPVVSRTSRVPLTRDPGLPQVGADDFTIVCLNLLLNIIVREIITRGILPFQFRHEIIINITCF